MTSEILDNTSISSIRKRDTFLLSYTKSGSKHLYLDYCKMRNLIQRDEIKDK